jgi:hypothetical protein
MQDQHMGGLQTHKQIFSAAIHAGDRPPDGEFLESCHVYQVTQLRLAHAHTGNRLVREPLCQTATNGFHFW